MCIRDRIYVYSQTIKGAGGMPIGTNGKAMLLLSGGIDSPVAGYMIAKRGVKIDAVYFHAPPYTSERACLLYTSVFQVENALKEAGDKIDANDKAAVEADLNALKDLLSQTANAEEMTDSQVADIKAAQEKMMESAQKLFAKMYEQTQQAGGQAGPDMNMGGGAAGSTDAGNNDDVVDADYKEV